jgi:glycosyltransferase involved in cell wall biosynthesis
MKRVLIDMHRLKHNPYNGLYIFSHDLGTHLVAQQPADMEFYFYLPKSRFGFFGNHVHYEHHRSVDKYFRFGTGKFDVWHITTTLSWYTPFHSKVKTVFTVHDLNFLIEEMDQKRNERKLKQIIRRAERADYIVGISHYALQVAKQYLPIQDKPQRVIYNGCSYKEYPEFDSPHYQPKRPFLFSIGQIVPKKNFHVLPVLLKDNDYELLIAGMGQPEYGQAIQAEARKHGVADRVHLLGPITEEEKYWYYKNCLAFMFPSLAEGFGLPVIEAMYCGKPVFLSTKTCLPEIGGDMAYYFKQFDPGYMREHFIRCMEQYEREQPQALIKARAKAFSWQKAAREYIEVYKSL